MPAPDKKWMWIGGAVLLLLSTLSTVLIQRVTVTTLALTVSQEAVTQLTKERDEAIKSKTEAESRSKTLSHKVQTLTAVLDAKGNAALDGSGKPIFNSTTEDLDTSEKIDLLKTSYEVQLMEKNTAMELLRRDLTQLQMKMTKPALRPITVSLLYEVDRLVDVGAGRWVPGLGYNFALGPWVWTASALVALPKFDEGLGYRAMLQVQP